MVMAIQALPKELYFPTNDSYIQTLYGQAGVPSTRDLILISRDETSIRKELFNIPTVAVCYRAIYAIRVGNSEIVIVIIIINHQSSIINHQSPINQ